MLNVFRRPMAVNLLQGRFCTGADTTTYANVSGRTQLHYAAASRRTRLHICKTVRRTLLHMQQYPPDCIEDIIACDTGFIPSAWLSSVWMTWSKTRYTIIPPWFELAVQILLELSRLSFVSQNFAGTIYVYIINKRGKNIANPFHVVADLYGVC